MKIPRHLMTILLLSSLLTVSTALAAPPATTPTARDKCPVCGMFVSKFPDWTAVVLFKDSSALFFDGAKDLFTYYYNVKKFTPAKNQGMITSILVKDYYALKPIDARKAYFVNGSNVYGPMGKELVPFEKSADADEFLRDHKGKRVLRFGEINAAVLKSLE